MFDLSRTLKLATGALFDREVAQQLDRALMCAAVNPGQQSTPATATPTATVSATPSQADPAMDAATLQAAQIACLREKVAAAQACQNKKRGFGRLINAATRTASRSGNYELAQSAHNIYYTGATAADLSAAAKDLGLTEDDVAASQNP